MVELPEVEEPVEPVVPVLLLVEEDDDGVEYEPEPEAPMPELEGTEVEPLTVPPLEPIPEAVPDAVPVELHAARAAAQRPAKTYFNIDLSCLNLKCMSAPITGANTKFSLHEVPVA